MTAGTTSFWKRRPICARKPIKPADTERYFCVSKRGTGSLKKKAHRSSSTLSRRDRLERERGTYLKKWKDKTPVALIYPNSYTVGMSSLGFQLVYALLSRRDDIVCERFFLDDGEGPPLSLESARPLVDFPLIFISVSFENDYLNIVRLLLNGGIEPFAEQRASTEHSPLLVCGGVAVFMNPEPIAAFMDFCIIGEAEPLLDDFVTYLQQHETISDRRGLYIDCVNRFAGVYAPALYTPKYENGRCTGLDAVSGAPDRVSRVSVVECDVAAHSALMTPQAEFSDLYLTELGRGCSRGCRFCAAGFIYRPPRLWDADAVVRGLSERARQDTRVGLLGMEMADGDTLDQVGTYLLKSSCALSFSSLRADRISDGLLELLARSSLKSAAIAPDGASERLRRVINKGLDQADLLQAARRLTEAGIYKLKLYVMIGLPTETQTDLQEFIGLVETMKESIDDIGKKRGRLTEIYLSVNCFVPKPWTPFQYHSFALDRRLEVDETASMQQAVRSLKEKIAFLKKGIRPFANVHFQADRPESALFQALLSRGDRRLAGVLLDVVSRGVPWKSSVKKRDIAVEKLILSGCDSRSYFPWYVIDHGISHDYLWDEYEKAFSGASTMACDTAVCRRCGVCRER